MVWIISYQCMFQLNYRCLLIVFVDTATGFSSVMRQVLNYSVPGDARQRNPILNNAWYRQEMQGLLSASPGGSGGLEAVGIPEWG